MLPFLCYFQSLGSHRVLVASCLTLDWQGDRPGQMFTIGRKVAQSVSPQAEVTGILDDIEKFQSAEKEENEAKAFVMLLQ